MPSLDFWFIWNFILSRIGLDHTTGTTTHRRQALSALQGPAWTHLDLKWSLALVGGWLLSFLVCCLHTDFHFILDFAFICTQLYWIVIVRNTCSTFLLIFLWIAVWYRYLPCYNPLHNLAFSGGWLPNQFVRLLIFISILDTVSTGLDCAAPNCSGNFSLTYFAGWFLLASLASLAYSGGWLPTVRTSGFNWFPWHSATISLTTVVIFNQFLRDDPIQFDFSFLTIIAGWFLLMYFNSLAFSGGWLPKHLLSSDNTIRLHWNWFLQLIFFLKQRFQGSQTSDLSCIGSTTGPFWQLTRSAFCFRTTWSFLRVCPPSHLQSIRRKPGPKSRVQASVDPDVSSAVRVRSFSDVTDH